MLSGLRVVEGSAFVAAPLGGMTLAQLGADVIRFDQIGGGLDRARWPLAENGESLFWAGLNKGKRSIQLDLHSPAGRELVQALVTAPGDEGGLFLTNFPARGWLAYDALLVAVGAQQIPALPHATTFGGPRDVDAVRGVLSDLEQGFAPSIAFVVPARSSWALPAYELALLTAGRARSLGLDVELTVITPEDAPLALFGAQAAAAIV